MLKKFDYIFAGAGCAGMSLLTRLLQTGKFSDKKILLTDKDLKTGNDRTWCFWEKGNGYFEPAVYKTWAHLWIHGMDYTHLHAIHPYRYKMVRGFDFYRYCRQIISQYPNVSFQQGQIDQMNSENDHAVVQINGETYEAEYVFNSILFNKPQLKKYQYYLLQHFRGWEIGTPDAVFDPAQATLMDFRIDQHRGTSFVYIMPFSPTRALVEFTVFSEKLLHPAEYGDVLNNYIHRFITKKTCSIIHHETGVIPMTNFNFPVSTGNIINIGTAGGQTKPSSGYTFQFIQKQAQHLINALIQTGKPLITNSVGKKRFRWYDATLLNILCNNKLPGAFIFTELFKRNEAREIMQFLDNETSLLQELKIIRRLPTGIFLKASLQQLSTQ